MRVGDKVKLSDNAIVMDFIRKRFESSPGVITEIFTDWDEHDIICWDVAVKTVDGDGNEYFNGFRFSDLVVVDD